LFNNNGELPHKLTICEGRVAKSLLALRANTTTFEGHMPSVTNFCDDTLHFARVFYPYR